MHACAMLSLFSAGTKAESTNPFPQDDKSGWEGYFHGHKIVEAVSLELQWQNSNAHPHPHTAAAGVCYARGR